MFSTSQPSTIKIVVSTLLSTIVVSTLVYAATVSGVMTQTIVPNDTIGAGWFQQVNDRLEQVCPGGVCPWAIVTPARAVMAFDLATCPTGWSAANGSGGTPDLRGEFVRGLDGGRWADPDSSRALRSSQVDMLKSHTHGYDALHNEYGGWSISLNPNYSLSWYTGPTPGKNTQAAGGTETRPRNVALLYCIKN